MFRIRLISFLIMIACGRVCLGDVVVLANRTAVEVSVRVVDGLVLGRPIPVPPRSVVPIETNGPCEVEIAWETGRQRYKLQANAAYYFGNLPNGRQEIQQIGLGGDAETDQGRRLPGAGRDVATIRVKILVDEEEPRLERLWQEHLTRRIRTASAILERCCRVRLEIAAFDTWNTDNATTDINQSMAEFEREVNPRPAMLAIGFSSQYHTPQGQTHMGGTRGPLHSHILLREWSRNVTEQVRIELLVHELGHYLGAAHSPEAASVMRPIVGDQTRAPGFGIGFDPVNTLTMYLVGEELRHRNVKSFVDLTPETKKRLFQIYTELARANPKDESVKGFLQLVWHGGNRDTTSSLEEATRTVLDVIAEAAGRRPRAAAEADERHDDALTEFYVRLAAQAAARLDESEGPKAFLLALGIALDGSQSMRAYPTTAEFVRAVESDEALQRRLPTMGTPTLHDREDLAKHFFVSAYLTAALGPATAASTGEAKELFDALTKSGFSFADMAANRAGIQFARGVLGGGFSLKALAEDFTVVGYMPSIEGWDEGMALAEFRKKYGGKSDARYREQLDEIDRRIRELRAYSDDGSER